MQPRPFWTVRQVPRPWYERQARRCKAGALARGNRQPPRRRQAPVSPPAQRIRRRQRNSQPSGSQYTPFQAGNSALFQLSLRAAGSPGTASVKPSPTPAGNTNTPAAGTNAKSTQSQNSAETVTPAPPSGAAVTGSLAMLAAQVQSVPNATAGVQTQSVAEPQAGSVAPGGQATARTTSRAHGNTADATAVAQAQAAAPTAVLVAGVVQGTTGGQASAKGTSSLDAQAQAASLGGTLAAAKASIAASISQSASAPSSTPAIESAAPALIVTDVRTHLAPEKPTAKYQALQSATTDTASAFAADLGTGGAASDAGQGPQPVSAAGSAGSHSSHSGEETPTPPPAVKQAVQSSEASAAPAASPSGQTVPSPVQQVFDAIQSAMPAASENRPATAASTVRAADYQPLKTITISFQPENLGTVTMQLSLKSSQLGVRLDASDSSTAQLLRQHDGDLTELLQSAGYVVGNIAIHAASAPAQADAQAQAGAGGQNASNMSDTDGGGAGGGSAGTEGQAQGQPGNSQKQRDGGYGRPGTADSDSSLYV